MVLHQVNKFFLILFVCVSKQIFSSKISVAARSHQPVITSSKIEPISSSAPIAAPVEVANKVTEPTTFVTVAKEEDVLASLTPAVKPATPTPVSVVTPTPVEVVTSKENQEGADDEEAIPDDLSEISDDADDILNRQEVKLFIVYFIFF